MAPNSNSSKLAHSLSIIVLVAVALALAPIVTGSYGGGPDEGTGGGHRDPHSPNCIPCSHAGACPWCHGGVKNVYG
ncbi:unnamed protein product [Urochloa humidicola]